MRTNLTNLFDQIDRIVEKIEFIEKLLKVQIKLPKEVPKNMSLEQALKFLNEQGYPISKSRLYKLTADRKIPHRKFANRLVFSSRELLLWCDQNVKGITINKKKKI